jgi:UDP-glucuronate 4-epimerase
MFSLVTRERPLFIRQTMRILVTGGAGFIGSHFVEKCLALGHSVAVIDEFNDFYDPAIKRANLAGVKDQISLHETDIRDGEAVLEIFKTGKFDTVVHLAARAGVRPSIKEPKLYIDTNITGTWNLLEASRQCHVPRFVCASSSSVYGVLKTAPFREDMALTQTISPYAATKLAAEQLCSNYAHLYGLRTINLRFFTVYGPRQRTDLAIHSFTRSIHEAGPSRNSAMAPPAGTTPISMTSSKGMVACLAYEGQLCDVFNLGESQTTTLR